MLFGLDTSGKVGQGSLYISIVENRYIDILSDLRKKIRKRHVALASRRRIKSNTLNDIELKWFIENLKSSHSSCYLSISAFSELRSKFMHIKNWKFKILACTFYLASKNLVNKNDVILIDRDYSEDVMRDLLRYLKRLFEYNSKNDIILDVGTSFNDVITLADIIAGCSKKNIAKCVEIKPRRNRKTI